jgi:hypothetical protein
VTFACGYVFVITCLAGALLPYRAKDVYEASPGAAYKVGNVPLVTILGDSGIHPWRRDGVMFMFYSQLGLTSTLAYVSCLGTCVLGNLVFHCQECPKIQGHQRGLRLQGDPARIKFASISCLGGQCYSKGH